MIDYSGKKLYITDRKTGKISPVEVLVAILPASSNVYAEASHSQTLNDFINSTTNALEFFGGVPRAIVTDCLISAVTKGGKYESINNRTYTNHAIHYNTTISPTRPDSPKDKAAVEGAVNFGVISTLRINCFII